MLLLAKNSPLQAEEWRESIRLPGSEGMALVDKPQGWTSFDVVAKMRSWSGQKKVGHAGTLDPLATGLLVLCFGKATKQVEAVQAGSKWYEGTVRLGATTVTDDAEGDEQNICDVSHLSRDEVAEVIARFTGSIEQRPPLFSAIKKDGVRLYKAARAGRSVEVPIRTVEIYSTELVSWDAPYASVKIHCGKGTYIRSIARDMGEILGCGGYLSSLRRTAIGPFSVDDAVCMDSLPGMTFRPKHSHSSETSQESPHAGV